MSDIEASEPSLGRRGIPERFASDLHDVPPESPTARPAREGLPSTYRMRADTHYVEQLTSRRDRGDAPEATVPAERPESAVGLERHRRSDRVMGQVSDEIATIASAASMLAAETSPLARRVGLALVRAQAWRATWLLKASAILDGRHRGTMKPTPMASLIEPLRQGLAPECRLSGLSWQVQASDANAVVAVDAVLVTTGVTGAVLATLGLMDDAEGGTVRVSFDVAGRELRAVEIVQDTVQVPPAAAVRFFDATWTDRPGGWTATMGALTAHGVARQAGGNAVFLPGDRCGSTIRIGFRAQA